VSAQAGILSGLRVVEVSAFVAAPLGGATLAALGADVIRVDPIGGGIDAGRWPLGPDGRSLYWAGLNQGKRSITLDLRSDEGRDLVARLITCAGDGGGILLTNLPARGWLDYETLRARRGDLIIVAISGSRDGGTAVDYTVNAGAGFPLVTGPEGHDGPVNHVLPAWDLQTGFLAALGVVAAERHRRLTGEGRLVQLALEDVALAVAGNLGILAEAQLVEEPRARYGNDLYGTYARDFRTADGRDVQVCALTPRQWYSLGEATGLAPGLAALGERLELDLELEGDRFRARHDISALLAPWFAERQLAEVAAALTQHGVLWGPYRTFKELAADSGPAPATALDFGGGPPEAPKRGPELGANTDQVLRELIGLADTDLDRLRRERIIAS
jgi:2-methylfumaryl-CoA isomerase